MKSFVFFHCLILFTLHAGLLHACQNGAQTDVVYVVDSGRSTGTRNYHFFYDLVENTSRQFIIAETATRVGLIVHDTNPITKVPLNGKKEEFFKILHGMRYQYNEIQTVVCLGSVLRLFSANYDRGDNVTKFIIIVTDGVEKKPSLAINYADILKEDGIHIFTIGVDEGADTDQLQKIASHPKLHLMVPSHAALPEISEQVATLVCEASAEINKQHADPNKSNNTD